MEMFTNRMAAARRTKILFMALVMLLAGAVSSAAAGSVEEAFKKSFPQIPAEQISETPVKGIYEVLVGNQILYYAPESDCLIIGAMVTKDGKT